MSSDPFPVLFGMTVSPAVYRRRRSKYGAVPTTVAGKRFASRAEAKRYEELFLLQEAGEIHSLRCQVRYPLVVNGVLVCTYVADFVYVSSAQCRDRTRRSATVVEDVKGYRTDVYRLKAKLMQAIHGIVVREVTA